MADILARLRRAIPMLLISKADRVLANDNASSLRLLFEKHITGETMIRLQMGKQSVGVNWIAGHNVAVFDEQFGVQDGGTGRAAAEVV